MRAISLLLALIIAFLLGGYVDHVYDWPFGLWNVPWFATVPNTPAPRDNNVAPLPNYSNAQGAQDPPRNDIPSGAANDYQKCYNTMLQRRLKDSEAQSVCHKIIDGISGG